MKTNLPLMAAGIFVLAPAAALASQPAQTPPGQSTTQTQAAPAAQPPTATSKSTGQSDPSCDTGDKSANAATKDSHPSAKVGKDTGDLPPPRKKVSKDTACAAQPQ
jgi:hypothetical protein